MVDYVPKRIIQIVSGSRSGSTLLKTLLAKSPTITSLDGEEETYIRLCAGSVGKEQKDDGFKTLENPELFRYCISRELSVETDPWGHRLSSQYSGRQLDKLLDSRKAHPNQKDWSWLRRMGIAGHYDGCGIEERLEFQNFVCEMPPYVLPTKRLVEPTGTLLLKSPYNVYRGQIMEQVYPNTQFTKILLTRNPAATLNGLIDGWESKNGFHKYQFPWGWWKFDAPPGWNWYTGTENSERALFQWVSPYSTALEAGTNYRATVRFEDLIQNPVGTLQDLCSKLEIGLPEDFELPLVMATETPKPFRWKKRERVIMDLLDRPLPKRLIGELGYTNREEWV